jgi:uncharacterized protein (DUF924 family)
VYDKAGPKIGGERRGNMQSPEDVLKFWFEQHGPDDWFGGKPEFDAELRAHFAATHEAVAKGEGFVWRTSAEGRLAEVIVLDQFSRQLYRGSPRAFAQDGMALVLAQEIVALGLDTALPPTRRLFAYMPYQHAESLVIQAQSLRLFQSLGDPKMMDYARAHFEVIQRFGRFCKRNAVLGRESTPEELAYIGESDRVF